MTSERPGTGHGPPTPRRKEPSLSPPSYVLNQHGARVLDSASALRLPGQTIRPTVYVGSQLLVRDADVAAVTEHLDRAAELVGLTTSYQPVDPELAALAERRGLHELASRVLITRVRLSSDSDQPAVPPDGWVVLQNFRALVGPTSALAHKVTLEHLMSASDADITGSPYMESSPTMESSPYMESSPIRRSSGASSEYAVPGFGGRAPVAWVGPEPRRCGEGELKCRRPVVAVLDTGAGRHPWLPGTIVDRSPTVDGLPIGLTDPATNGELTGTLNSPLEGNLDSNAGHGTFIAGLIRQRCPDANILSIRVMYSDGIVEEGDLLAAVNRLLFRRELALVDNRPDWAVDVVTLSLGYYHELPSDAAFDQLLLAPLRELGARGVAVIAAAGNDATPRHMYPAGFTPNPGGPVVSADRDVVPVVSVGALNPDGQTIALFSNAGDWVLCHRRGAAVISTMPTTFNASLQAVAEVSVPGDGDRAGLDMDNFRSGFATWSGTSFAAPILAGEFAQQILTAGDLDSLEASAAVPRAWTALGTLTGLDRPPSP